MTIMPLLTVVTTLVVTDRQTETYYGYTPTCIHIHLLLLLCLLMGVLSFEWSSLVLVRSVRG
jgi:hypothetical protein